MSTVVADLFDGCGPHHVTEGGVVLFVLGLFGLGLFAQLLGRVFGN